ncbi:MAG: hypothetical protein RL689_2511, partial [Planctomycetota bacterium]
MDAGSADVAGGGGVASRGGETAGSEGT